MEEQTYSETPFQPRVDLSRLNQAADAIRQEIGKIIVGQHDMVTLLITAVLTDGHILLEGVPGVAKTLSARLMAHTISANFSRIQFTPDLMPSDVLGTPVFNVKTSEFEFKSGPIFSNLVLIDEINRAPAKTQAALFECMQEKQITVDGITYKLEEPFMVLATQNPVEHEGTYRLPEAQLDRFLFRVFVPYPTFEQEAQILKNYHAQQGNFAPETLQKILSKSEIQVFREMVQSIVIEDKLMEYIAQIVNHTRNNSSLFLGASPRASLAILNASKAYAALSGRDFVTPEDIKFITPHVLNHRIQLTPEREMEGITIQQVIGEIVQSIEVPR